MLEEAPTIIAPEQVTGLRFLPEVETINRAVGELRAQGVRAIVVLIHQGGSGNRNGGAIRGQIVPIMMGWTQALGVRCDYCHVDEGRGGRQDFAADYLGPQHAGVELSLDPAEPLPFAKRGQGVLPREQAGQFAFVNELDRLAAADYPEDVQLAEGPELIGRGGSAILGPDGSYLAGPLWDEEGLLLAGLDRQWLYEERQRFDPAGHYHRPDVLSLRVRRPTRP